jgi:hypothetical protein
VKFFSYSEIPLLGAVINRNSNAGTFPDSFAGGHNLHKMRFTTSKFTIPVFPTGCR